jgi:regulator of sigma E protease
MSTALTILGLSLLIILHELGHFLVARACGMRVLRFSVGFGPALVHRKLGETDWQIAAIPLGGYVQIDGMGPTEGNEPHRAEGTFRSKPVWQRSAVIFAGPVMNFLLAAVFIAVLAATVGFSRFDETTTTIGEVVPDQPAAAAGLLTGDRVVSIDGEPVASWKDMVEIIRRNAERPVPFEIERSGETLTFSVTPASEGGTGRIGVGPKTETIRLGVFAAAGEGFRAAADMTARQAGLLWGIVVGKEEGQLSGLPGIVKMVSAQAERGVRWLLEALAWLSITLFIFNLAPVPALDGGRLFFLVLETARGRPVDQRFEGLVHAVGFLLLLALIIYVSIRDVVS